jgi:hypothetical protein
MHRNTSNVDGLRFSAHFSGEEFFLADHVVQGARVLPGVAQLEMLRCAAAQALGADVAVPAQHDLAAPIRVGAEGIDLHWRSIRVKTATSMPKSIARRTTAKPWFTARASVWPSHESFACSDDNTIWLR